MFAAQSMHSLFNLLIGFTWGKYSRVFVKSCLKCLDIYIHTQCFPITGMIHAWHRTWAKAICFDISSSPRYNRCYCKWGLTYDAIRPIMNTPLCKLSAILNDAEEILYVVILRHKASLMSSPLEGNIKKAGFQSVSSVMIRVYRIIAESMDGLRCLTTIPNGCCLSEQPSKTAAVESIF